MTTSLATWLRSQISLKKVFSSWIKLAEIRSISTILLLCSEYCTDIFCKNLTEFNTPLVEAVDTIKEAFDGNAMLVESKQLTAVVGIEGSLEKDTK